MFGWIMLALFGLYIAAFFAWALMWWGVMLALGWSAMCLAWVWRKAWRALRRD